MRPAFLVSCSDKLLWMYLNVTLTEKELWKTADGVDN